MVLAPTPHHRLLPLLTLLALVLPAEAGLLSPLQSFKLAARPRAVTVLHQPGGDVVYLLLADGRLATVSLADTLRIVGQAPAGATALAGVDSSLYFATQGTIVSTNIFGQWRWQSAKILPTNVDSLTFVSPGRGETLHCCAWAGDTAWLIALTQNTATSNRLRPGHASNQSLLCELDGDGIPEFVAAGPDGLLVADLGGRRELVIRVPAISKFSCADIDQDGEPEIVGLAGPTTDGSSSSILTCLGGTTAQVRWSAPLVIDGSPASGLAVLATTGACYVAGTLAPDNQGFIAAFDDSGRQCAKHLFAPTLGRPVLLAPVAGRLLVIWRKPSGPETFHLLPANLADAVDYSPGYNGVTFRHLLTAQLGADTFPDLVVVRTAADSPYRIDLFKNNLHHLRQAIVEAEARANAAALAGDETGLQRALRRLELLNASLDPNRQLPTPRLRRTPFSVRRLLPTLLISALGLGLVISLALILLRRRKTTRQLIESLPLSVRTGLAVDFVALEHNFISKGNWPAALDRLIDIRDRAGLKDDYDLGQIRTRIEPHYSAAVTRLIERTPTDLALDFITKTALHIRPETSVATISREQLDQELAQPGFRILCVRNREYPDIYGQLRWFSSPRLRSVFEHLLIDHFSYAHNKGAIVLDYIVSTQWNRKLLITLYSDSTERIDLGQRQGHLVSELTELVTNLRPALDAPGPDWQPAHPEEKLWLRITDLISVLQEAHNRLQTQPQSLQSQ